MVRVQSPRIPGMAGRAAGGRRGVIDSTARIISNGINSKRSVNGRALSTSASTPLASPAASSPSQIRRADGIHPAFFAIDSSAHGYDYSGYSSSSLSNSGVRPLASTSTIRKSLSTSTSASTLFSASLYHSTSPLSNLHPRCFSSSSPAAAAMVATKLDGTAIAKAIREKIGAEIAERQKLNPRFKPCLKIIQGASTLNSQV